MDPQQRGRLRDDLRGFFKGEIRFDDLARSLYSTDASIFQITPAGVVSPRDEDDVRALVRYAHENAIPLIARGAGTGLAGESLGAGLVVDLSRNFRDIVQVGADTVRVQPGVVHARLNARLAEEGRRFAPDTGSTQACTLGGMLANNSSGATAIRHGTTRDHVESLRVVLDNGDVADAVREPYLHDPDKTPTRFDEIRTALSQLLDENQLLITAHQPFTRFNRCGYTLDRVLHAGFLDLPRLLVGSEGTLGVLTEATLRTIPLPGGKSLVLLGFAAMEAAFAAVPGIVATGPAACEMLDRRLLSLAKGSETNRAAAMIPSSVEAVLLVVFEGMTGAQAEIAARNLVQMHQADRAVIVLETVANDPASFEEIWRLREAALPSLFGVQGGAQAVPLVEDVGVPVELLADFMRRLQEILHEHETTASFLVHAGAGQVHTRPFIDLQQPEQVSKLWGLAEKIHSLALDMGGTVSSQHGTGLARGPWVARQTGAAYPVHRQVKAIFDPLNLFNPGKIVDPEADLATRTLRGFAKPQEPAATTALQWKPLELQLESNHCNGCGQCRTEDPAERMCPIFRGTHHEAATPRAKANLLRSLLDGGEGNPPVSAEAVRDVADLCVNCRMCATECPARVNIPKLMLEAKAANVAAHGLSRSDWFFARLPSLARLGQSAAFVTNAAMRSRMFRWILEKTVGLSARRKLPRLASKSFLSLAHKRGWTQLPADRDKLIVYFVDWYANYVDPQLGEATVRVLQHHGYHVFVPPDQLASGIEALALGDADTAREIAQRNVRVLADLARQEVPIVCTEPGAVLMLTQDYLSLLDDEDARAIARQTVELTAFLGELHRLGKLDTRLRPMNAGVGHHVPCHVKATQPAPWGPRLLGLIPDLRVHTIDVSCSGMAGTFGLQRGNVAVSLAAGAPMIEVMREARVLHGSTECSSCRLQIEDAAGKPTLHPVQYLALAYGLMPELQQRLK